jgi:hypothetical protein
MKFQLPFRVLVPNSFSANFFEQPLLATKPETTPSFVLRQTELASYDQACQSIWNFTPMSDVDRYRIVLSV